MQDDRKYICLYHADCLDGFTAAYNLTKFVSVDAIYPVKYGENPPDVKGKHVIIVDFSYPKAALLEMQAESILIIDHHKTAEADLAGLPAPARFTVPESGIHAVFDMNKSGASLVHWFFSEQPTPMLTRFVEDRDLWRFNLRETRDFIARLALSDKTLKNWRAIEELQGSDFRNFLAEGSILRRNHTHQCYEYAIGTLTLEDIGGHLVPVCNVPWTHASETAHLMLELYPDAPFAATFFIHKGKRKYSLRSEDSRLDVSEIARANGGGGHRNAAGFSYE